LAKLVESMLGDKHDVVVLKCWNTDEEMLNRLKAKP
jgi:hypothetical protein